MFRVWGFCFGFRVSRIRFLLSCFGFWGELAPGEQRDAPRERVALVVRLPLPPRAVRWGSVFVFRVSGFCSLFPSLISGFALRVPGAGAPRERVALGVMRLPLPPRSKGFGFQLSCFVFRG